MKNFLRSSLTSFHVAAIIGLALLPTLSAAQLKVPDHGGVWVHDEAGVLSAGTKAVLESTLKMERDSTTNQIAILIVPSLQGDDIDSYGLRVSEAWKLGNKDNDNGVLFLVAIKDHKMRIEVGQGLEGVLTDALSSRINRNEVAPRFRQGDYEGGVVAGVESIIKAIKGQYVNNDPPARKRGGRSPLATIIIIIILLIILSRRRGGGIGGYWAAGALMGGLGGGRSGDSWGSGSDYGGGGSFGGGGSSDSW